MKKVVLVISMALAMMPTGFLTEQATPPPKSIIPDPGFYAAALELTGKADGYAITPQNVSKLTFLNISNRNIQNLAGIEYFTALKQLICGNNRLAELDVSNNAALELLSCWNNRLTGLDVSKNTALARLVCYGNNMDQDPGISVIGWRDLFVAAGLDWYDNFWYYPQKERP